MPMVTILGTATTLLTRYVLFLHQPERFLHGAGPTISRTAAFPPGSMVFAVGICATSVCAAIAWIIVFAANAPRCPGADALQTGLRRAATACGCAAALFLALLAIVNSNWHGKLHEAFSVAFYASQVLAFLLDTLWWRRLPRFPGASGGAAARRRGSEKTAACGLIFALSAVFLGLYITDKADLLADETALDFAFVVIEYTLSILCFWYSSAMYRELTAYLRETPEAASATALATE